MPHFLNRAKNLKQQITNVPKFPAPTWRKLFLISALQITSHGHESSKQNHEPFFNSSITAIHPLQADQYLVLRL